MATSLLRRICLEKGLIFIHFIIVFFGILCSSAQHTDYEKLLLKNAETLEEIKSSAKNRSISEKASVLLSLINQLSEEMKSSSANFVASNETEHDLRSTSMQVESLSNVSAAIYGQDGACGIKDYSTKNARNFRVLISTSERYISVLVNWLVFFYRTSLQNLLTFFQELMNKFGLKCEHIQHFTGNNVHRIWIVRTRLAQQLLHQGIDVLMSDSDAIWLRNPFTELNKFSGSDIISSRASFPKEMFKRYGATLCMGFIYFKSTKATKLLVDDFGVVMARYGSQHADDQRDLNFFLYRNKLEFSKRLNYLNTTETDIGNLKYKGANLQIALLPHESFRRVCDGYTKFEVMDRSSVVHCLQEKNYAAKKIAAQNLDLWVLQESWHGKLLRKNATVFIEDVLKERLSLGFLHP